MTQSATARIGLIGLGEAGGAIASGLAELGVAIVGYDARADAPAVLATAERAGVTMAGSVAELVAAVDVVMCLTKAAAAVPVARAAAAELLARHVYADLNSASPEVKRAAASAVEHTGAQFADVAIMAAVLPHRHLVPMVVSGSGAKAFSDQVRPFGMHAEVLGDRVGQASAVKMYRSLLVKGIEALVFECALGASAEGALDRVLESMAGSLPFGDWAELATYLMGRSVAHGERRAAELREVAATLDETGIDPALANAAAARLEWVAARGLQARFAGGDPRDYQEILDALHEWEPDGA
jgi:3-hydroxyisobutyrate dehydrogenase-like beta-hydroxyacid dehydrogenase